MMLDNYFKKYRETIALLRHGHLKSTIALQKEQISNLQDWALMDECVNIEETYEMMLKYFSDGVEDPKRSEVYESLIARTLVLAEKIKRQQGIKNNSGFYYSKLRVVMRQSRTLLYYTRRLQTLYQQNLFESITANEYGKTDNSSNALIEELFDYIWVSAVFGEEEIDELVNLFDSTYVNNNEKQWLAGALIMSILYYFDKKKLELLVTLTHNTDPKISCYSIVGITLLMFYYRDRFLLQPNTVPVDTVGSSSWSMLQILYLKTSVTKRIRQQVETDFMPLVMNLHHKMDPEKLQDILQGEESDLPDGVDAEMVRKIREGMRSMTEQVNCGMDMYYSSFANLKNHPFFVEVKNWFKPFALNDKGGKYLRGLETMTNGNVLCDSDKYSLALTISTFPPEIIRQIDEMMGQVDEISTQSRENLAMDIVKDNFNKVLSALEFENNPSINLAFAPLYLQDLYRFFTIKMRNELEGNPFANNEDFLFIDADFILPTLGNGDLSIVATEAYKQHSYLQAIKLFEILKKQRGNLKIRELLICAFSYAMLHNYKKAVSTFEEAPISFQKMSGELRNLYATCLINTGETAKAIEVYEQLYNEGSSSLSPLNFANALYKNNQYKESQDVLFKEDFINPGQAKVERQLILCLLKSKNANQALAYCEKLLRNKDIVNEDHLIIGHTYIAIGDTAKAIEQYKVYANVAKTKFVITDEERQLFSELNVPSLTIKLVSDAVN